MWPGIGEPIEGHFNTAARHLVYSFRELVLAEEAISEVQSELDTQKEECLGHFKVIDQLKISLQSVEDHEKTNNNFFDLHQQLHPSVQYHPLLMQALLPLPESVIQIHTILIHYFSYLNNVDPE